MTPTMLSAIGGFFALFGCAILISWLAFLLGRWLGRREARREHPEHQGPVGSVVGATLALVAFTLAITFNMTHTKHNDGKKLVREDAKAIRTAYDRALLLPPEAVSIAHEKLAEYAQIRAFNTFEQPDVPLAQIVSRSEAIQRELWVQAVEHRAHPGVRFYMDSLSHLINTHAERITVGFYDRVPFAVWICLIVVTALGMVTLGYQSSLAGSRRTWAMVPLVVAFCAVLTIAADLDQPQEGILRIDQGPMVRVAASLKDLPDAL